MQIPVTIEMIQARLAAHGLAWPEAALTRFAVLTELLTKLRINDPQMQQEYNVLRAWLLQTLQDGLRYTALAASDYDAYAQGERH